jgi:HEAT repeat protein
VFLTPDQYPSKPAAELLLEVAKGRLPFDHRLIRHLDTRREETVEAINSIGMGSDDEWRFDIDDELLSLARHFNDVRNLPYLIRLLHGEDPPDEVFDAVQAIGAPAIEPLIEARAISDDADVRGQIAFALAATGIEDERIQTIVDSPSTDDSARSLYAARADRQPFAFDIYEETPEESLPEAEGLTIDERFELLDSPIEEYRVLGAASLFHEDFGQKGQDRLLELARTDPSEHVRAHAWQALDNALDQDPIVDAMLKRLADPATPTTERCGLIIGLAPLADRPEVLESIVAMYEQPETRLKALEAMWRSLDPDFADYFPRHLDDADLDIRRVALRGVGALGMSAHLGKIRTLFNDPDVREDALFAFAMASPGTASPAFLRSVYKKLETEAGGFTPDEDEVVRIALDERLRAAGKPPVFVGETSDV